VRVFVDTNVLAAGLSSRGGLCASLVSRLFRPPHAVVVSTQVLAELATALERCRVPPALVAQHLQTVRANAEVVADVLTSWPVRDPDDVAILGAAEAAQADVLVTGDRDLLDVADGAPIRILAPRELWDFLKAGIT
jgi:uncharacterized protein